MKRRRSTRLAALGLVATIGLLAAACTTTPPPPEPVSWTFKGTSVTINASQDAVYDPIFGACISLAGCSDEPYLYQIAFRVKIGEPGSAQTFVVKGSELSSTGVGATRTLTGGQQAAVAFGNVVPLDVLTALNPTSKLEIVGTYTWAAEGDLINSLAPGADGIAEVFKNALNSTVASSTLPEGDANALITLILNQLFNNVGSAFKVLVANFPCLGLCDDLLGAAVYIGIGANGALGSLIDSSLSGTGVPAISLGGDNVPPKIVGGGFYTMNDTKNFSQSFSGSGGRHSYNFTAGPAVSSIQP